MNEHHVDEASIARYIAETFDGVDVVTADGNSFFFYDPGRDIPPDRRFPFATLVANDLYDQFSNLNRPGVFRLNLGVSRESYRALVGEAASGAGESGTAGYDFAALDTIMPHPVYGQMHWLCVLNPSPATFTRVQPLLAEAYGRAARRHRPGR